jgi:phage-related protein
MPTIGARCSELRITDVNTKWRIIYRADQDAIVIAAVFCKKTTATPDKVIAASKRRLRAYDDLMKG